MHPLLLLLVVVVVVDLPASVAQDDATEASLRAVYLVRPFHHHSLIDDRLAVMR